MQRMNEMDVAKGIGIICVILGHTFFNRIWVGVNTFHMPMFFMISGFFFKPDTAKNIFLKSKKLFSSYFITILAFILYSIFIKDIHGAKLWLWGGIYGCGYDYETPFIIKGTGGIWFLLALFWVRIITNEVIKIKEGYLQFIVISAITFIGIKTYACFVFPWSIQNGMFACIFFYSGYILRYCEYFDKIRFTHGLFYFFIWLYCYKYFGTLTMVNCSVPCLMNIFGALSGSIILIYLSKIIDKRIGILANPLSFIGKNTLPILCFHIFELHTGLLQNIINAFVSFGINIHIIVIRLIACVIFAVLFNILKKRNYQHPI